jgi:hypothetical protein
VLLDPQVGEEYEHIVSQVKNSLKELGREAS